MVIDDIVQHTPAETEIIKCNNDFIFYGDSEDFSMYMNYSNTVSSSLPLNRIEPNACGVQYMSI